MCIGYLKRGCLPVQGLVIWIYLISFRSSVVKFIKYFMLKSKTEYFTGRVKKRINRSILSRRINYWVNFRSLFFSCLIFSEVSKDFFIECLKSFDVYEVSQFNINIKYFKSSIFMVDVHWLSKERMLTCSRLGYMKLSASI